MEDLVLDFQKGALVAQDPTAFESLSILTEEDKELLRRETTHKWSHPRTLYYLVVVCSMAAAVQGMDEAVINGANLFFASQFGIDPDTPDVALQSRNQWLYGLVNSAPYLCCAVLGCWLTDPVNILIQSIIALAHPHCKFSSIDSWDAAELFSSLQFSPSSLAFGKDLPTVGGISSSLDLFS
ncbi:mfs sugar transporter, partial [Moniliophthora roreri]